ncbi:MAG: UDP-N-acetylmuramate dehydrogenase [Bacteroidales bacterium]|nr:UDP-N-acetylmuramate dehydrogenase [Bacteroidales bacterium]
MKVFENISLKPYNTFGIDVKARRLVVIEPDDDLSGKWEVESGKMLVIGAGSNMVFTKDYDGTIITLDHLATQPLSHSETLVTAWAGMVMDDLVLRTIEHGLYGLENLSAIPGTVGASAVQNVGAYGAEAKDFIESVEAYDLQEGLHCTFSNADCQFAYRDSFFKHHPNRYLILRVTYRLSRKFVPNLSYKALEGLPHDTAQQLRNAIIDLRWSKLPRPEEHGSAGSFFKNPVVDENSYLRLREEYPDMPEAHSTPQNGVDSTLEGGRGVSLYYKLSAGWLIDRAGWKGRTQGRAGVWHKNALVLYNADDCTGADVVALAQAIQQDVKQKFGVELHPEAIII